MTSWQDEQAKMPLCWEYLSVYGIPKTFARKSFIYTPNDSAQELFFITSGQVHLSLLSTSGRILTLHVIDSYHLFGHSVLSGCKTYDTFAEAVVPTQTLSIPRAAVLQTLVEHPKLGVLLVEMLGQYLLATSRRLDELAFKSVPARLASILLDMADETMSNQRLPHRTHQQLADMTNTYRATVTKVIKQFRSDRLLDMDRSGITLLNTSRLREVARGV
jgi:CRP-like cAMP-binding protein